jgi:hypothetical protein
MGLYLLVGKLLFGTTGHLGHLFIKTHVRVGVYF